MKTLRVIVIAVVALVALGGIAGFFLPSDISVSRSVIINAPRSEVFKLANSLRAFSRWSPWTSRDPDIKFSFEGPDSGVGQKMTWHSAKSYIGSGAMEITDSLSNEKVVMTIAFGAVKSARSSLALDDAAGATKVTWSFAYSLGANPFARYLALVMPSAVGSEYAHGLATLKQYVEAIPKIDISALEVTRVSLAPHALISVDKTGDNTPEGMTKVLAQSYRTLSGAIETAGLTADGPPISIAKGANSTHVTIETAFPVKDMPQGIKLPDGVQRGKSDDGEALRVAIKGNYASLETTYLQFLAYALVNGWKVRGSSWNEYIGDPTKAGASQLETNIYLPVE